MRSFWRLFSRKHTSWCAYARLRVSDLSAHSHPLLDCTNVRGTHFAGDWTFTSGYFYVSAIQNCSVTVALTCLAFFYAALKEELRPHKVLYAEHGQDCRTPHTHAKSRRFSCPRPSTNAQSKHPPTQPTHARTRALTQGSSRTKGERA